MIETFHETIGRGPHAVVDIEFENENLQLLNVFKALIQSKCISQISPLLRDVRTM